MIRYQKKRGEGYLLPCVLTVILCMLLSVFLTFAEAFGVTKQTQRNSRVVLDSYVMQNAVAIYDSVKQGNDKNEILEPEAYKHALAEFCTFAEKEDFLYHYDSEGNLRYSVSAPVLSFVTDRTLKIRASYTVYVPIFFAGVKVNTAEIPVTVTSRFNEK